MKNYKILLVKYLESDINLVKREIGKVLEKFQIKIVDTKQDFVEQMNSFVPDLVISDFKLPSIDALTVLNISTEMSPVTPVIVISETFDENAVVECFRAGAADYITKEHIKHIGKSIAKVFSEW